MENCLSAYRRCKRRGNFLHYSFFNLNKNPFGGRQAEVKENKTTNPTFASMPRKMYQDIQCEYFFKLKRRIQNWCCCLLLYRLFANIVNDEFVN